MPELVWFISYLQGEVLFLPFLVQRSFVTFRCFKNHVGLVVGHLRTNLQLLVSYPGKPVRWSVHRDMTTILLLVLILYGFDLICLSSGIEMIRLFNFNYERISHLSYVCFFFVYYTNKCQTLSDSALLHCHKFVTYLFLRT